MIPITRPPAARVASATTPIRPTLPPPVTSSIDRAGERPPEVAGSGRVAGIVPRGGTTEDADATHAPSVEPGRAV